MGENKKIRIIIVWIGALFFVALASLLGSVFDIHRTVFVIWIGVFYQLYILDKANRNEENFERLKKLKIGAIILMVGAVFITGVEVYSKFTY